MKYCNGRTANNGELVLWFSPETILAGMIYGVTDDPNRPVKLARIDPRHPSVRLSECLHVDDVGMSVILSQLGATSVTQTVETKTPVGDDKLPIPRLVVCAAIRNQKGQIIAGARHYDNIMRQQIRRSGGMPKWRGSKQGFIDQLGNFLTRTEAMVIAKSEGQLRRNSAIAHDGHLYSENLY